MDSEFKCVLTDQVRDIARGSTALKLALEIYTEYSDDEIAEIVSLHKIVIGRGDLSFESLRDLKTINRIYEESGINLDKIPIYKRLETAAKYFDFLTKRQTL